MNINKGGRPSGGSKGPSGGYDYAVNNDGGGWTAAIIVGVATGSAISLVTTFFGFLTQGTIFASRN